MEPFLTGEKIYLASISSDHVTPQYVSWLHDKDVVRGLYSGKFPTDLDQLQDYVSGAKSNKNTQMFAVHDRSDHSHVGNIKLDQIDWISRIGELGIAIGSKDHWGKGIGKEACQLLIQYAFGDLNLRKITLSVFRVNEKAKHLYEKLGFVEEGCLKNHVYIEGKYHDKIFMSLFNE